MYTENRLKNFYEPEPNLANGGKLPARDQIEEKYKWNLKDIYSDEKLWNEDFIWVEKKSSEYKKYEGTLSKSSEALHDCLKFDDEVGIKLERLCLYASLSKDLDLKNTKQMELDGKIKILYTKVMAANSFIRPEILAITREGISKMYADKPELKLYEHYFDDLFRAAEHTLSKEQEEILALASEVRDVPYNVFSLLTNADMKFPAAKDAGNNDYEVSHARFYSALYTPDRKFREEVYKNYYSSFMNFSNTFAALLNGALKSNIFNARARKFNSAREAALSNNNIPVAVYDNLVNAVNGNFAPMHRWTTLKKKMLKLKELHPYDSYVSLFSFNPEYKFEKGKKIVLDSLECMGKDYCSSIQSAFDNRWLDVYETPNKRSGAYSSGTTFGVHPYVLLNWTDLLNDVFTLTHEIGHNMHSYYTGLNQPYVYANYSIFLAEIASTFNESLLLDHLINTASSSYVKLALLEKYLNNITTTFYRQTMFAEFEQEVYKKAENGEGLTPESFSNLYRDLYQKYWGNEMIVDKEEEYTWARIPHFYYNYYVYQYATGFAASEALVQKIKNEGSSAVEKYLEFLKSGSSDYSINILKRTGVDMTTTEPFTAVITKMNYCLDQMEELL
jgi:oligoendopeptidase F